MEYHLYPWQETCLKEWEKRQFHGIVNVVTGAGKTILAMAAAKLLTEKATAKLLEENTAARLLEENTTARLLEEKPAAKLLEGQISQSRLRIKIVVPSAALLTQWVSSIRFFFDGTVSRRDVGLYYGGRKDSQDRLFMIYVINSARYSLARHIVKDLEDGCTVFLIADECHRYTGHENQKIFDFLPFTNACPERYASLGLSATPGLSRPENASVLIPALGPEIFRYGIREASAEETLCPYTAFHIALSFTPQEKADYEDLSVGLSRLFHNLAARRPGLKGLSRSGFFQALYQIAAENGKLSPSARMYLSLSHTRKNLTQDADARIRCVIKIISLLEPTARIIIFGERTRQANLLYEKLERLYPNQTARCHSAMDAGARKLALERFRDGEIRILISCRALDEGFDVPSANVGIVMSSASVNRQRIQRLGRILRRHEGKEFASLYYLYIKDSSEEPSYFPVESQTGAVCELSYHLEDDAFSHPAYEKRARAAMEKFKRAKSDTALLSEAADCFGRGIIRPDWKMGKAYCEKKIRASVTVAERNYWICMKQLGE